MRPVRMLVQWICGLVLAGSTPWAVAQTPAGQIMVATGTVDVIDGHGNKRAVARGDALHAGERVVTGTGGLVQIKTVDGGYISVRPDTEMVVEKVHYDAATPKDSSFVVGLIKGGFRSITGAIGKANPDGYEIRTSTATIGIRGTDHEPMFVPPSTIALPDAPPPGIYDKVNAGETFIRNQLGVLAIKTGQIGFSPVAPKVAPEFVRVVPAFYREAVKMLIPPGGDAALPDDPRAGVAKLRPRLGGVRPLTTRAVAPAESPNEDNPAIDALGSRKAAISPIRKESTLDSVSDKSTLTPELDTSSLGTTPLSPTPLNTPLIGATKLSPTLSTPITPTLNTTVSRSLSTTIQPLTTTISPTLSTTTVQPLTTTVSPTLNTTTTLSPLIKSAPLTITK